MTFARAHVGRSNGRWAIQRVLTNGGPEFKGAFDEACQRLRIRHTSTRPRHAWTNGFVERLQGTIPLEHWRVEFRRSYFASRAALARSLEGFLRLYNEHRPQGTGCAGTRLPRASGAPCRWRAKLMHHSGPVTVSTPFRFATG
jgi:transposase InsO family protein